MLFLFIFGIEKKSSLTFNCFSIVFELKHIIQSSACLDKLMSYDGYLIANPTEAQAIVTLMRRSILGPSEPKAMNFSPTFADLFQAQSRCGSLDPFA
jgi:hypothetical protein